MTAPASYDCLVQVLEEPGFRKTALGVREEMLAMPTPSEIVPLLERMTAEHRA